MFKVFQRVQGHQKILQTFQYQLEKGRFPKTSLFYGPEGIGKRQIATCVTAALFCPQGACGQCSVCYRVFQGQHPDFHQMDVEKGKKQITIESIREIQETIQLTPFEAKSKVILVDRADKMNIQAANCFLKTLEEPPLDTYIFFITNQKSALLPTILSRLQCIRFLPFSVKEIHSFLKDKVKRERAEFLAELAQGSLGKALQLMEQDVEQTRQDLFQWIRRFEDQDRQKFIKTFLSFVPENVATKEESRQYLSNQTEILLLLFRDLRAIPLASPILHRDQLVLLQSLSKKIYAYVAEAVLEELYEYLNTLNRNANIELATQIHFTRIYHLLKHSK
jgi:DNA polymerase-3 subunit delta'